MDAANRGGGRWRRRGAARGARAGALLLLLDACSPPRPDDARPLRPVAAPGAGARTAHVVLVSVDGLRPDAIEAFDAVTLRRLMGEGSYTLEARTIDPSRTLPSHTSMLTGVTPAVHGVTWNSDETATRGVVAVRTVFDLVHAGGLGTAAFFSKAKLRHLERPGTLDHVSSPRGWLTQWGGDRTIDEVEAYLTRARPNLLVVHLPDVDVAGHRYGWMTPRYGRAVRHTDTLVARLLAAADRAFGRGDYTVLVTADHGGAATGHGGTRAEEVTIPWIAWGRGVRTGTVLPAGVRTMDTAATTVWLLGVEVPRDWSGAPVAAAFAPGTPLSQDGS